MKALLLFFVIICSHFALGQIKLPVLAFHKQRFDGNYIGSIVVDYTLALFNDSSVRFECYENIFGASIKRTTYLGNYSLNNDTLTINYSSASVERKTNQSQEKRGKDLKPDYPASVFILGNKGLWATDRKYKVMDIVSLLVIKAIETDFENWGNTDLGKVLVRKIKTSGLRNR